MQYEHYDSKLLQKSRLCCKNTAKQQSFKFLIVILNSPSLTEPWGSQD